MATKPTTPKTAAKRPAATPKPVVSQDAAPLNLEPEAAAESKAGGTLKLKTLVDRVTETSGVKKKDVRSVVDAVLEVLGGTLKRGEGLALPGLGTMRVARKATEESPVMTLKLRQGDSNRSKPGTKSTEQGESDDTQALAEDSEQV